jgi:hypothetical protein
MELALNSPWVVICLTIGLVILINAGLVLLLTRSRGRQEIDLFRSALGGLRQPWRVEDEMLSDLRRSVDQLKSGDQPEAASHDRQGH